MVMAFIVSYSYELDILTTKSELWPVTYSSQLDNFPSAAPCEKDHRCLECFCKIQPTPRYTKLQLSFLQSKLHFSKLKCRFHLFHNDINHFLHSKRPLPMEHCDPKGNKSIHTIAPCISYIRHQVRDPNEEEKMTCYVYLC